MRQFFIIICMLLSLPVMAQRSRDVQIQLQPSFADRAVEMGGAYYTLPGGDSVQFETFRCYVSNVIFYSNGMVVFKEAGSYHLVDAADAAGMQFVVHNAPTAFDEIGFDLGIDSVTNVSGALGGDLDPTKGMYWSWQSGYINLKLEGRSNLCKTRKNEFQFHLGGYAKEMNALAAVRLKAGNGNAIKLYLRLDKFLQGIDLATNNSIMIPGKDAVVLAKKIAGLFEATAP